MLTVVPGPADGDRRTTEGAVSVALIDELVDQCGRAGGRVAVIGGEIRDYGERRGCAFPIDAATSALSRNLHRVIREGAPLPGDPQV
ncbi:hypothetical protein Ppa06_61920 [Planomonospora parontospora subsp. parontospora]|uniref:Uncharacterized protein n=2 Tax=Planomonospora parontospora TaxID=58119 RepID=A0AA37F7J5_9ACTN|nr:hypothetical protein [Planomonospora parontospora]GGK93757.1 hypothetical protein GCM10010126_61390 [Planomonospora parontospora]GII12394.1 hypothetical protein Ppa06_61920 [Planomonospora parontospora subsp. parontospora]